MKISLPIVQKVNGVILYKGPSLLNGKPIVCIATGLQDGSSNRKTGDFIQTYILPTKEKPTDAINSGNDDAVCGDCIHRKKDGFGTCYVNAGYGPNSIFKSYSAGKYPIFDQNIHLNLFKDKLIRLGAWGDPSAIPVKTWESILEVSAGHTGYTHQWRKCDQTLKKYCMASVESEEGLIKAKKMGWKTFRVRRSDEPIIQGEFICPASIEANKRLKCETCLACKGGEYNKQVTPVIISHGLDWKSKRFNKMQKLMVQKKKFRGLFNGKNI